VTPGRFGWAGFQRGFPLTAALHTLGGHLQPLTSPLDGPRKKQNIIFASLSNKPMFLFLGTKIFLTGKGKREYFTTLLLGERAITSCMHMNVRMTWDLM